MSIIIHIRDKFVWFASFRRTYSPSLADAFE
jgi:hypothetical protein